MAGGKAYWMAGRSVVTDDSVVGSFMGSVEQNTSNVKKEKKTWKMYSTTISKLKECGNNSKHTQQKTTIFPLEYKKKKKSDVIPKISPRNSFTLYRESPGIRRRNQQVCGKSTCNGVAE